MNDSDRRHHLQHRLYEAEATITRLLSALATARREALEEAEKRETAWLIERNGKWWGPPCSRQLWRDAVVDPELWTADANQAVRFARKEDAEAFMRWEGLEGGAKATEHIWLSRALLSQSVEVGPTSSGNGGV